MGKLWRAHLRWPVISWLLLLAFNWFFTPSFFRIEIKDSHLYGSLIDVFDRAAPVLLLALGMALVIGTGGVDLSVGAIMALSGAVAATVALKGHNPYVALATVLLVSALCGAFNGFLVAALSMQPIVATLILMVAGRGFAQLLTDGQIISMENPVLTYLGNGWIGGLPAAAIFAVLAYLLTSWLVRGTALGLFVEASGGNSTACRLAGVPTRAVVFCTYVYSGLCAGLAGLIVAADIKAADGNQAGMYLELDAILAVVLGGTSLIGGRFSLAGAFAGAILMQTLTTTILSRGIPVQYNLVVKAIVILAVCLLQAPAMKRWLDALRRKEVKA
jgi:galactofuranose transport system permease protein